MIEDCQAMLVVDGRMGTLSEFTIAFEEKKPIAVLTSSGGISKHLQQITKWTNKHRTEPVFFDSDIKKLLKKLFDYLETKTSSN